MIMDAQSVYDSSGHPRRYSFQEHTALYEAAQTDPAMSPEEYSELEGHQIASG